MHKPKPVCDVCRRRDCDDPTHKRQPKPMNWKTRRTPRGHEYQSWPERRRRKQVVDEWVEQYGHVCPRCGARDVYPDGSDVQITADHVTPIAMGGSESGDLRVLCRRCQTTQAAQLAAMRRERHRG